MPAESSLTGAAALIETLRSHGVDTAFANPGTSEVHLVQALAAAPEITPILTLFEGVATGALDGFGRMRGQPAAALLHLGPGLGNGIANLHNMRRAGAPGLVVIGDHPASHLPNDPPLACDIESLARPVSKHVGTVRKARETGPATAAALAATVTPEPGPATLIVSGDAAWDGGAAPADPLPVGDPAPFDQTALAAARRGLKDDGRTILWLGGEALSEAGAELAGRIAAATGAELWAPTFTARMRRGAGSVPVRKLPYFPEAALNRLADVRHLIRIGAPLPVSFFAYQGLATSFVAPGTLVHDLCGAGGDVLGALAALAEGFSGPPKRAPLAIPPAAIGALTAEAVGAAIARHLPEGAILSEEPGVSGAGMTPKLRGAPLHETLDLMGGAIGQGLPVALGAAVACPDRRIVALQADGSALYTIQALWSLAREGLDVVIVLLANSAYQILKLEGQRIGLTGEVPGRLFDLDDPALDFVALARGFGVPAEAADTAERFEALFAGAMAQTGPFLIEARLTDQG